MKKRERKKFTFWSDFKKFISKGNVVDLAVAVVIGGSFGKITTGLVNFIITPFTSLFLGQVDMTERWKTVLVPEELNAAGEVVTKEVALLWGAWVQTMIDFVIIAFSIFLVLRIITGVKNRLHEKEAAAAEAARIEAEAKEKAEAEAAAKAKAEADAAAAATLARKEEEQKTLRDNIAKEVALLEEIRDYLRTKA